MGHWALAGRRRLPHEHRRLRHLRQRCRKALQHLFSVPTQRQTPASIAAQKRSLKEDIYLFLLAHTARALMGSGLLKVGLRADSPALQSECLPRHWTSPTA